MYAALVLWRLFWRLTIGGIVLMVLTLLTAGYLLYWIVIGILVACGKHSGPYRSFERDVKAVLARL